MESSGNKHTFKISGFSAVVSANFGAVTDVDVYAEILARICKETSTSFFVTSVIPLIPGSTLYYCMNSIVEGNTVRALEYGRDTFLFAFGIAAGMSIAWSICYFLRTVRKKQN